MSESTLRVRVDGTVGWVQLHRPDALNAINTQLVTECAETLRRLEPIVTVVVLEGLPDVFCSGADFHEVVAQHRAHTRQAVDAGPLYDLWLALGESEFVSVAHVRGRATAGGVGFVAACDIVLAERTAQFSLSELLFGTPPACVMPFLVRRIGLQRARYMALSTRTVDAQEAREWGLVDACEPASSPLLQRHLARLARVSKPAVRRFKAYAGDFDTRPRELRARALAANREAFSDPENLAVWRRFTEQGLYPWERGQA